MSMDWDAILDGQTEDTTALAPANKYTVKVIHAEGVIARTGNPMVKIKTIIVGGPYANTEVWTNIVITPSSPKAMKWTLRKLSALGISRDYLREHKPDQVGIAALLNESQPVVEAEIGIGDEFEGVRRNEISNFRALTDQAAAQAAASVPANPVASIPTPNVPSGNAPTAPRPVPSSVPMPGQPSTDPF